MFSYNAIMRELYVHPCLCMCVYNIYVYIDLLVSKIKTTVTIDYLV